MTTKLSHYAGQTIVSGPAVREAVQTVMQGHVGATKGILKEEMFKYVFGHKQRNNDLADYFRGVQLAYALSHLRSHSHCFIVSRRTEAGFEYFVVKTQADAEYYHKATNFRIKAARKMMKRCDKAVKEQWWKEL